VGASVPGAEYKGLAIGSTPAGVFLYAANFSQDRIDVFNGRFQLSHVDGDFVDPGIPAGYAPFNVKNLKGLLYVTYAKVGPTGDDEGGPGHGFVSVFDQDGHFMRRLASHG